MTAAIDPITKTLENWHAHIRGQFPGGLDALLHDDVTFYSPVVFTPQQGKAITMLYLNAAGAVFSGDTAESDQEFLGGEFRYTKEVASGNHAVLEFETAMNGKSINGVDIITCDSDGLIVEFRVMIRPLQAVNAVHESMQAML